MRTLRTSVRAALAAAADLLLPRFCLGCARRLTGPAPLLLCAICRGRMVRVDRRRSCRTCARPLPPAAGPARNAREAEQMRCLACRRSPPPFDRLIASWVYAPPLDQVIRAMKFGRLDFLAGALVTEALGIGHRLPEVAAVVPVPMPLLRRIERGFNQADRLARALAAQIGKPCCATLRRTGLAPVPQRRLGDRERRLHRDLRFASRALGRPLPAGTVLLVDDVVTTGSTLRAAAGALGRADPAAVVAWALAATPAHTPAHRSESL